MEAEHDPSASTSPVELTIERMATGGEGVARLDSGQVVFVQGALPGERVHANITERKKRFARAETVAVLSAADQRISPRCDHAIDRSCGGCDWMWVAGTAQRDFKVALVVEQLQRLGGIDTPTVSHRPHPQGQRTTVRCLVTNGSAGYRSRGSNDGFVAQSCSAAHPLIEELVVDGKFGPASEVTLRVGAATGERIVLLHGVAANLDDVVVPPDVTVAHYDDSESVRYHEEVLGNRWQISAQSFFQTSQLGAEALVASVQQFAGDTGSIADLYAGVGLLGGSVDKNRLVASVESNPSSVRDAHVNLAGSTEIVKARVERWTPIPADVVIADPARRGLEKGGCATIEGTGAERLVLVSCDPAALGRDAQLLGEYGWRHQASEVIDMFPDSSRIEAVTLFER